MEQQQEQVTAGSSTGTVLLVTEKSKTRKKKMSIGAGVELIMDLAREQDGQHSTRKARDEAFDTLDREFGISGCELYTLLMAAKKGERTTIESSLIDRRHPERRQKKTAQLS